MGEECGNCKEGFFEPYCTGCTFIDGCKTNKMTCTTAADTKCEKCAPGYFPSDPVGEMDVCSACQVIDHCTKAFCTNSEDHICLECAFGYYPAGATCAPVVFEDNSIFTYEFGPNHDVVEITDADFCAPECTRLVAGKISEDFSAKVQTVDLSTPDLTADFMTKWIGECESAGCVAESMDMGGGLVLFNGCSPAAAPRRATEYGFMKQL